MTLEEISKLTGKSESSFRSNFKRTAENLYNKQNIIVTKTGRGNNTDYQIEYTNYVRAETLYEETKKEIILSNDSMSYPAFEFLVFLTLATTSMLVFRGSYNDFLDYVQLARTESNILKLQEALNSLYDRDIIMYQVDKTDDKYFVAAIYRKVEEETRVGIEMVRECKRLQEKYKKREWIPLLKVWIGISILVDNQPYTKQDLMRITGLNEYSVTESSKILEQSNIFQTSRAYNGYHKCLGKNVDLNAFVSDNLKLRQKSVQVSAIE